VSHLLQGTPAQFAARTHWSFRVTFSPPHSVLGPAVGGFAAQAFNWRWPLYELAWISVFTLVLLIFLLPETSADTILLKRAARLRKLTGDDRLMSQSEIEQAKLSWGDVLTESLVRPFQMLLEPEIAYLDLYVAVVYSIFYLWFE
jgi:DHA1 family multidrug resistance protein-like MFS transporter